MSDDLDAAQDWRPYQHHFAAFRAVEQILIETTSRIPFLVRGTIA
jgi:hypothetical protein